MGESQKRFNCIRTSIAETYNKHFMYANLNNKTK